MFSMPPARRRLTVLVLAAGFVLSGCSAAEEPAGDPSETQGPLPTLPAAASTATETPSAEPTESLTPEQQAEADAKAAIVAYFQAVDRVLQDPQNYDPLVEARSVAASTPMDELTQTRQRQLTAGLRSEGAIAVESMEVIKADYTGGEQGIPTLEIATCFNSRGVVFYRDGELIEDLADSPTESEILGVVYDDVNEPVGWRVMYHRPFDAESPSC